MFSPQYNQKKKSYFKITLKNTTSATALSGFWFMPAVFPLDITGILTSICHLLHCSLEAFLDSCSLWRGFAASPLTSLISLRHRAAHHWHKFIMKMSHTVGESPILCGIKHLKCGR